MNHVFQYVALSVKRVFGLSDHCDGNEANQQATRSLPNDRWTDAPSPFAKAMGDKLARCNGFSLVELSVVLVIIGLLAGGILIGQNLIRAAELRSVTKDFAAYQAAVTNFTDQYRALPGDIPNATRYWGALHATPATCYTMSSTSTLTCNGNGNGIVGTQGAGADIEYEQYRFWQHLSNAGFISGNFTGFAGPGNMYHSIPGTNVPKGKIANSGFGVHYAPATNGSTLAYAGDYGQYFMFGAAQASSNTGGGIMTPREASNIDIKIDDGKPATGKLWVRFWNQCTTSTSETDYVGKYELSNTSPECALLFIDAF